VRPKACLFPPSVRALDTLLRMGRCCCPLMSLAVPGCCVSLSLRMSFGMVVGHGQYAWYSQPPANDDEEAEQATLELAGADASDDNSSQSSFVIANDSDEEASPPRRSAEATVPGPARASASGATAPVPSHPAAKPKTKTKGNPFRGEGGAAPAVKDFDPLAPA
jgi:hypothetical protein